MEPIFAGSFTDICQYTVNALLRNPINYSPDNILDTATKRTVGECWVLNAFADHCSGQKCHDVYHDRRRRAYGSVAVFRKPREDRSPLLP